MDLLLVRHGVTQHNTDRVFMGHDPVPLAAEGRRQIERLGERLRGEAIDAVVASDIVRARESAEILSAAIGLPFESHQALREVDVGSARGLAYLDAARRWPEVFAPEGAAPFPGGESFAAVADRAAAYLRRELIDRRQGRILVVTHGGVVRGVTARLLELPLTAVASFVIDNASLTVLRAGGGGVQLLTWNDTAHLGPLAGRAGSWAGG